MNLSGLGGLLQQLIGGLAGPLAIALYFLGRAFMLRISSFQPCNAVIRKRGPIPWPWNRRLVIHVRADGKIAIREIP